MGTSATWGVAVADMNGDGNADIVTADPGSNAVSVLLNNASGGELVASGSLSINDPDAGESSFVARTGIAGDHGYGTFNIDATGAWSYTASNDQSAIQALNTGDTLTDSFTVSSFDGSATQDITVTIVGIAG